MAAIGVAAIAIAGLVVWRVMTSAGESADTQAGAGPIATLSAPDVHSLLIDPRDPERIFFGSHAGIQESADGGFTWSDGTLRDADAMQLAVSPASPETIYATGHDVFQVSRDGGRTWQPHAAGLPGTDIHGFAQDPVDPDRLFAFVVGAGLHASGDGGVTWEVLPSQPAGEAMHLALAAHDGVLYAATGSGIVITRDEGATWDALPSQPAGQVISLAAPAGDAQVLYAGTPDGLAKSADGGATWTALGPTGVPVLALAASSTDANQVLFVNDTGEVYRSDDGGLSWRS